MIQLKWAVLRPIQILDQTNCKFILIYTDKAKEKDVLFSVKGIIFVRMNKIV